MQAWSLGDPVPFCARLSEAGAPLRVGEHDWRAIAMQNGSFRESANAGMNVRRHPARLGIDRGSPGAI